MSALESTIIKNLISSPSVMKKYIKESHNIFFSKFYLDIIIINSAFCLILFGIHFVAMHIAFRITYLRDYQNILLTLITLPITAFFLGGLIQYYLSLVRHNKSDMKNLFRGGSGYFQMLLFLFIYYSLYIILAKVILNFAEFEEIMKVRLIFGFIFFLWLVARLFFAPILIIEQGLTVRKALKTSFLTTSGRTTRSFMLCITFTVILISGLAVLILGVIYTLALTMCAYVLAYDIYSDSSYSRRKTIIGPAQKPKAKKNKPVKT